MVGWGVELRGPIHSVGSTKKNIWMEEGFFGLYESGEKIDTYKEIGKRDGKRRQTSCNNHFLKKRKGKMGDGSEVFLTSMASPES